ncbi:ribosomal protein S27AE [Bradyrhizobium elkanii]|nr:ribosomal protein S27AE [Bradyrhizobium elkanii]MCS3521598.1 ribosomal protein S27AE [Bradyrhizobium elkanii]MCS4069253.1 ribosomal protein S27AE [Bradyrhizobium elkanii]MCS4084787.1 ribosomal protein S27AE [Bradyrhizobium elkanii]MCS4103976.1 ribosomal protein S27AE [Bradyrhizobium elkanii]
MRWQCGRTRTIVLDKHFRTALICPKCDEGQLAGPARPEERVLTAR